MKKLLTLLAFIGCTTAAVAQKNCRNVDDKKDAFTGKMSKQARLPIGGMLMRWLVELDQVDGETTMKWRIAMTGEYNAMFPEGTNMMFKLDDGTVLKLGIIANATPVTQVNGGAVFTQYDLVFKPTKDELTQFAQSAVDDVKLDVQALTIKNANMKKGQMKDLRDACACLLTTAS